MTTKEFKTENNEIKRLNADQFIDLATDTLAHSPKLVVAMMMNPQLKTWIIQYLNDLCCKIYGAPDDDFIDDLTHKKISELPIGTVVTFRGYKFKIEIKNNKGVGLRAMEPIRAGDLKKMYEDGFRVGESYGFESEQIIRDEFREE